MENKTLEELYEMRKECLKIKRRKKFFVKTSSALAAIGTLAISNLYIFTKDPTFFVATPVILANLGVYVDSYCEALEQEDAIEEIDEELVSRNAPIKIKKK